MFESYKKSANHKIGYYYDHEIVIDADKEKAFDLFLRKKILMHKKLLLIFMNKVKK